MYRNQSNQIVFEQADEQNLPVECPDITLIIEEKWDGSLMIRAISTADSICISIPASEVPNPAQCWEQLTNSLQQTIDLDSLNEQQRQSVWLDWEGTGGLFYERFIIGELRRASAIWPMNAVVSIETNEAWIPWELIHDGNDFWGKKFIIARKPTVPNLKGFEPHYPIEPQERTASAINVTHVVGSHFSSSIMLKSTHYPFTNLDCRPNIKRYERKDLTLAEVAEGIKHADVIHFTCHGHITPPSLQLGAVLPSQTGYALHSLWLKNIRLLKDIANSIVFANACNSNRPVDQIGQFRSFGWEFYCQGVAVYIGTLGLIPTQYAIEFAEVFYEHLFQGKTVGESLRCAKERAREQNDNPFWLLYSMTGDPFVRKQ